MKLAVSKAIRGKNHHLFDAFARQNPNEMVVNDRWPVTLRYKQILTLQTSCFHVLGRAVLGKRE